MFLSVRSGIQAQARICQRIIFVQKALKSASQNAMEFGDVQKLKCGKLYWWLVHAWVGNIENVGKK